MPIVVPVSDPDAPLSQGDLLKGVALFQADPQGAPRLQSGELWSASAPPPSALCLVLSRPCVARHKNTVVVAAVVPYKNDEIKKYLSSFRVAKKFYEDVRDGKSTPDLFYLGQLEGVAGTQGSYCVRLDSLHTIELPDGLKHSEKRKAFVRATRVARLDEAFAHDLHQRFFRAFASLGFDDDTWYPTTDLEVLVAMGDRDRATAEAEYNDALAALKVAESQSEFKNDKERTGREEGVAKKKGVVEDLERELAPLRAELKRRKPESAPDSH